ncbi:GNAT family N-acetyltransferase [Amnibacterium setariae]|uniref:GNAT family N-acetyltransferase n=1 Tax=Amnibacterium setariae TaxID=2306585 RepID=A0A3A1U2B1_9MICO|nr:GNAT family N-acetyltransferase [Amnibacterium setariae]RIX31065.1 GNAT family N-acetyltransferase [Amnibacterium setariae]
MVTELVRPDVRFHASFVRAVAEFGDAHLDGASDLLPPRSEPIDAATFSALVDRLRADALEATPRAADRVPATALWIVEGDELLGFLQIRHRLTPFLLEQGGHIGYSVRPSARRRGHASAALRAALPIAHGLGIDPVLVCCLEDNAGSRAVIEGAGGRYEDSRQGHRRYWIPTA